MIERGILGVDDEEAIRDVLAQAFSRQGFRVRPAASAEEALEILEKERY